MAHILLIDDEHSVLDFLQMRVKHMGHTCVRAASCAEGLEAAKDPSVEIIIADIYLPDSNEPTNWMAQIKEAAGDRPLIMITGFPEDTILAQSKSVGVTALLTKPFELVFLDDLLSKATHKQAT